MILIIIASFLIGWSLLVLREASNRARVDEIARRINQ